MPKQPVSLIVALIYPVSLIVAFMVAHYWWHLSDVAVAIILAVIIGGHVMDEVTDKLDAMTESVESLRESLEELNAKVSSGSAG
jgi:hypothetical protein